MTVTLSAKARACRFGKNPPSRCYGCGQPIKDSSTRHRTKCPIFVSATFPEAKCPCGDHVLRWPERRWYLKPGPRSLELVPLDGPPDCVLGDDGEE